MIILCHCVKGVQIRSFFLVGTFPFSVRMGENTDQKKLRIWTLFTQWYLILDIQTTLLTAFDGNKLKIRAASPV